MEYKNIKYKTSYNMSFEEKKEETSKKIDENQTK